RVLRRPEGDDAAAQRAGRGLHVRRPAEGAGRAALDPVLPAAPSQCRLFGGADGPGGGVVLQRPGALPGGARSSGGGAGRGRHAVAGLRAEAVGNAAAGGALQGRTAVRFLAGVKGRRISSPPQADRTRATRKPTGDGRGSDLLASRRSIVSDVSGLAPSSR